MKRLKFNTPEDMYNYVPGTWHNVYNIVTEIYIRNMLSGTRFTIYKVKLNKAHMNFKWCKESDKCIFIDNGKDIYHFGITEPEYGKADEARKKADRNIAIEYLSTIYNKGIWVDVSPDTYIDYIDKFI